MLKALKLEEDTRVDAKSLLFKPGNWSASDVRSNGSGCRQDLRVGYQAHKMIPKDIDCIGKFNPGQNCLTKSQRVFNTLHSFCSTNRRDGITIDSLRHGSSQKMWPMPGEPAVFNFLKVRFGAA